MSWEDGLYVGRKERLRLDVRLDRQAAGGRIDATVSCDFVDEGPPRFLGTFRTTSPADIGAEDPSQGKLTCHLKHLGGLGTATLHLYRTPTGAQAFDLAWKHPQFSQVLKYAFSVSKFHPGIMRRVTVETDRDASVPHPGQAVSLGSSGRPVTAASCLRETGIEVVTAPNQIPVFGDSGHWTITTLHDAIYNRDGTPWNSILLPGVAAWRVYLLQVRGLLNEPDTLGIMPDWKRRGAAIFHDAISRKTTSPQAYQLLYNYAVVHEVGHAFNLPHAFEHVFPAPGSDHLTFMNYPTRYTGGGPIGPGVGGFPPNMQRFFSQFDFQFSRDELMEIRHGDAEMIVMGGKNYRGQFGAATALTSDIERLGTDPSQPLQLTLRLRRPRADCLFEFGEPVHVELKLEVQAGQKEVWTDARLDPSEHHVQFTMERPNGTRTTLAPFATRCVVPTPYALTPEKSLHEDVCVSFSEGQWVTQEPGFYRVQAFCQVGETVLASRPLTIFVRYPNRRTENHIVPLLIEEVATYLALEGGPHLTAAVAGLDRLEQEMPQHPLVAYFRLYRCLDQGTGFKRFDRGKARVIEATPPRPEYKAYVGVIAPQGSPGKAGKKATGASADAKTAPSPFSNVHLDKIGRKLHATLAVADPSDARKYLKVLAETLQGKRRRVPREKLLSASEVYSATLGRKKQ